LELLSVRSQQSAAQLVDGAVLKLRALPADTVGLSPHAPYSTGPELIRIAAMAARENNWILTTHVAESADEFEMYMTGSGAMFDWLKSQRDTSDCGRGSPIATLSRQGALSSNLLAVHANYLAAGDAELLANSGTSVVHCPRSHAFFGHQAFPLQKLREAGVNVCLGTDSLATMAKARNEPLALNMFAEMRAFGRAFPELSPAAILSAATSKPAKALGRQSELGVLTAGAFADLIAVPFGGGDCFETILEHRGDVCASMIRGQWMMPPKL
jgi:cytosine/adenosine deaminase-related metal-dependent hydrolase